MAIINNILASLMGVGRSDPVNCRNTHGSQFKDDGANEPQDDEKTTSRSAQLKLPDDTFKDPNKFVRSTKRSRSRSPSRANAKHLPNSRAVIGKEAVLKSIRQNPSFEDFNKPEIDQVVITRDQYKALQDEACHAVSEIFLQSDATAWEVLQNPIDCQKPLDGKSRSVSDYKNTHIDMKDMKPWKNFPEYHDIKAFIENDTRLSKIFFEVFLDDAGSKVWNEKVYGDSGYIPPNEENSLARNLHAFFNQLSTLIKLVCQGLPGHNGLISGSQWVTIGGGKCAMKRRTKGNPRLKVPDLAAFWTNGDYSHLNAKKSQPHPACQIDCLIVGDFKMADKFNRSLLLAKKAGFYGEGKKVADQIHDYMDMHHNRYGYIITHTDLIMFRRREDAAQTWGQVDFSDSIPVSAERGKLNAMMVLWYFHVKYAVMGEDGGWKLPSYYHNCPKELLGTSVQADKKAGVV